MTAQEFSVLYNAIRHKLIESEVKKYNKTELQDLLKSTADALCKAESLPTKRRTAEIFQRVS